MEKEAIETRTSSFAAGEAPAEPKTSTECSEIMRAIEVVERDSAAIAESFNSLFSSLRLALSEVTTTSVENMQCFSDVVGRVQESALDAATKGNRYINSCLRLNEEMKGVDSLAMRFARWTGPFNMFVCEHLFIRNFWEK
ncbi:BLOC-1-related complex subunit 6 protein [Dioscorea alata]|uniref:BLOC-1-related complex subunit 6 protein n=1 Tax=Dioscorea alata TaxID=55571 RepID=A0ACB7UQI1_DIOAL|nr:BLOC-1-related complex subunit 6 protein [Dioscorea alata]